jgi:ABC-type nitrate/sulfonate/bicarbonate transport system substrate-binding protein
VFGELQITFGLHAVAARLSITRQLQVLIQHLLRGSADFYVRSIAVVILIATTTASAAIVVAATAIVAAATAAITTAGSSLIGALFHLTIFCCFE